MKGISVFLYSLSQGVKSLRKNSMFTIASIGTIVACLFLFGLFYFIVSNFQNMIHTLESSVSVTVFFDEGISEKQVETIGKAIEIRSEVLKTEFITAEQAWKNFKEDMFKNSKKEIVDSFGNDNPLENSSSYEVYLNDISKQGEFTAYVEEIEGVRQVNRSDKAAKNLSSINVLVGYVSGTIILILLIVSIFLIRTTISTGITVRKTEISIMKLIGASDYFIRAPFVVEGIFIGIIGAIVPLFILFLIYDRVIGYITDKFTTLSGILVFLSTRQVFGLLIPICLLLGVGIGFVGSYSTVRKHLR